MNNPNRIIFLIDDESEFRLRSPMNGPLPFASDPRWLKELVRFFGGKPEIIVLVSEHDSEGKRFQRIGAETVFLNGNRKKVLSQRLPNLLANIRSLTPWAFFVVSRDPALAGILEPAAEFCPVIVYCPGEQIPQSYREAAERASQRGQRLETRLLSEVQLQPRPLCNRLFVDAENLVGCFTDWRVPPDAEMIHLALTAIASRDGKIAEATYLGDWMKMPGGKGLRAGLTQLGANLRQVDSRSGQKSTDHVLVAEVTRIQDQTDHLYLFTNDTDFRHLIRDARANGVKVTCIVTQAKVTQDLRAAADEVVFLEDYLPAHALPAKCCDPAELAMAEDIVTWMRENAWFWLSKDNLYERYAKTSAGRDLLERLIRKGYLRPGRKNPETTFQLG